MAKYIVIKNTGGTIQCIQREDGASIPVCDDNTDYHQYLTDVEEHGAYPISVISDPVIVVLPTVTELQEQLAATNAVLLDMLLGV